VGAESFLDSICNSCSDLFNCFYRRHVSGLIYSILRR
jgi:hypothetical protein